MKYWDFGRPSMMILLIVLGGFMVRATLPQQPPSPEVAGQAAEQAGKLREALSHYVAALQTAPDGSDADQRLREKIIAVALKVKPAPILPADAIRLGGRAKAAISSAQNASDFLDAAKEYRSALRLAPWYAPYYFNLAVVLEKAGQLGDAIRNYKLYELAAPNAQDTVAVQEKIGQLEYELDRQAKLRAAAEQQEAARRASEAAEQRRRAEQMDQIPLLIPGVRGHARGNDTARWTVTKTGEEFVMRLTEMNLGYGWRAPTPEEAADEEYRWRLDGNNIRGSYSENWTVHTKWKFHNVDPSFSSSLTGSVDPLTLIMHLEHTSRTPEGNAKYDITGYQEHLVKLDLRKVR